jgi:hypothetical protein
MPLLRQILMHATDKTHWLLRAKALECISLVGMAIGRDRFREDAHKVLIYMQQLQASRPYRFLNGHDYLSALLTITDSVLLSLTG